MDFSFSDEDEAFRAEARAWLTEQLEGPFAGVRGRGGPGDEHALFDERLEWEHALGAAGWTCVGWPKEHGGRGLSLYQQVIWFEEYARASGPGRLGPHRRDARRADDHRLRHAGAAGALPARHPRGHRAVGQGYSEPNAGSDLANVQTRAERDGDEWVITGQKVWTSLAHWAHWCFVLCRTDREAPKHKGISYLLVPLQPGRGRDPARSARSPAPPSSTRCSSTVPAPRWPTSSAAENDGWKVAMGTLAFERGASTLGQQLEFQNRARPRHRAGPRQRSHRRPRLPPAARRRLDRAADDALEHAAGAVRAPAPSCPARP